MYMNSRNYYGSVSCIRKKSNSSSRKDVVDGSGDEYVCPMHSVALSPLPYSGTFQEKL